MISLRMCAGALACALAASGQEAHALRRFDSDAATSAAREDAAVAESPSAKGLRPPKQQPATLREEALPRFLATSGAYQDCGSFCGAVDANGDRLKPDGSKCLCGACNESCTGQVHCQNGCSVDGADLPEGIAATPPASIVFEPVGCTNPGDITVTFSSGSTSGNKNAPCSETFECKTVGDKCYYFIGKGKGTGPDYCTSKGLKINPNIWFGCATTGNGSPDTADCAVNAHTSCSSPAIQYGTVYDMSEGYTYNDQCSYMVVGWCIESAGNSNPECEGILEPADEVHWQHDGTSGTCVGEAGIIATITDPPSKSPTTSPTSSPTPSPTYCTTPQPATVRLLEEKRMLVELEMDTADVDKQLQRHQARRELHPDHKADEDWGYML